MDRLSPRAQRLLELARHEDDALPQTQSRVGRAIAARIALGAGVAGTGASAAKSAAAAGFAMAALKPLVVTGLAGALAVGGWHLATSRRHVEPPHTAALAARSQSAAVDSSAPVEPPPVAPAPEPARAVDGDLAAAPRSTKPAARPRPGIERSPRDSEPTANTADSLHAETEALRSAQQALRSGDFQRALALLDQQDVTYRTGMLQEERAAARVLARCEGGRLEQARGEAARFELRWPRSALVARVRSACRDR
jgi:hypothetical protein